MYDAYWTDLRSKRSIGASHLTDATCAGYNYYDPLLSPRVGVVDIRPGFDWRAENKPMSWQLNLHSFRFADYWILKYMTSGDAQILRRLEDVSVDYIRNVWDRYGSLARAVERVQAARRATTSGLRYVRSDTSVAARAAVFAFLLGRHKGQVFESLHIDPLEEALHEHIEYALDDRHYNSNNHGLFNDCHLLIALVNAPDTPTLREAAPRVIERLMTTYLERQVNEEGIHLEHTPSYAILWILLGEKFLSVLSRLGELFPELVSDAGHRVRERTELVSQNLWWFAKPNGALVNFGEQGAVDSPDWIGSAEVVEGTKLFRNSGYAFYKRKGSYLAFVGAYHSTKIGASGYRSASHKQRDELHLVWSEGQRDILIDTGLRAFDFGVERRYTTSKQAHNTLSLHPSDYLTGNILEYMDATAPYGSAIEHAIECTDEASRSDWVVMVGSDPLLITHDILHRRVLLLEPGRWLIVCDLVRLPEDGTGEWNFHLSEDWKCMTYGSTYATFRCGAQVLHMSRLPNQASKVHEAGLHMGDFIPLRGWRFFGKPIAVPNLRYVEQLSGGTEHLRAHAFRLCSQGQLNQSTEDRITNLHARVGPAGLAIDGGLIDSGHTRALSLQVTIADPVDTARVGAKNT